MLPSPETEPFVHDITPVENDIQHDTNVRGNDVLTRSSLRERRGLIRDANTDPGAERLYLDCRIPLCDEHERCEDDDANG